MSHNHNTSTPVGDVPLGVPAGSSADQPNAQARRARGQLEETNTPTRAEPERPVRPDSARAGRGRIGGLQLERIAAGLSDRDHRILNEVAAHGYLTTKHIEGLQFAAHAHGTAERLTRRTMTRLDRLGLVQALERRVGGVRAGSSARIWQLSSAGRRLVGTQTGAKRPHEPSPRLLAHSLAVADIRLALATIANTTTAKIDTVEIEIESAAWRRYLGLGGDQRLLQPDLAATVRGHDSEGPFEDRWFIEVDCGTESIPTLLKKCRHYDDYRQSGTEQDRHGVFPRVLWVMGGPRAEQRQEDLTRRLGRTNYPDGMFAVALPHEVGRATGGGS